MAEHTRLGRQTPTKSVVLPYEKNIWTRCY